MRPLPFCKVSEETLRDTCPQRICCLHSVYLLRWRSLPKTLWSLDKVLQFQRWLWNWCWHSAIHSFTPVPIACIIFGCWRHSWRCLLTSPGMLSHITCDPRVPMCLHARWKHGDRLESFHMLCHLYSVQRNARNGMRPRLCAIGYLGLHIKTSLNELKWWANFAISDYFFLIEQGCVTTDCKYKCALPKQSKCITNIYSIFNYTTY